MSAAVTLPAAAQKFPKEKQRAPELVWYPQRGYGVLEAAETYEYGEAYFDRFARVSDEPPGRALNEARCQFVEKYWTGHVLDIGVGSGAFLERWGLHRGWGYDVAEAPRKWLQERGIYRDPFETEFKVATCFDSLEHMDEKEARAFLDRVGQLIFVSIPIFESAESAFRSKHMKPGEHRLYFTERGLRAFMAEAGLRLLERSRFEEGYGRDEIASFVFYREGADF